MMSNNTYVYEITAGLQVHDLVQVRGTSFANGKVVVVELLTSEGVVDGRLLPESARSEVPFRCMFSFDGSWELIGRVRDSRVHLFGKADYSITAGESFSFQLVPFASRFVMYHDEEELFALNYLQPLSSISHLALAGDANFSAVEFMDSHDFLKRYHPESFERLPATSTDSQANESNDVPSEQNANEDCVDDPLQVRASSQAARNGDLKSESRNSPSLTRTGPRRTRVHADAEALNNFDDVQPVIETGKLGGSLQSVAMTNPALYGKLFSGGLVDLQQIDLGVCERAPVPMRIGREVNVSGRLSRSCEKFYLAISTVSNKHVAKLLQGEVTLLVSVQLNAAPAMTAYLLHGPVYTELSRQHKLPANVAPGQKFSISIHYLYRFITVLLNGAKCTNYSYDFFEQADRNLRFPLSQLIYISVWGDIDKKSIEFYHPESLLLPYYNSLLANLGDYDKPEVRIQVILHKTTSRVSFILQHGDGDPEESPLIIRCIVDVEQTIALFETEKHGKLISSKSTHRDELRRLRGHCEFALQMDLSRNKLNLIANKVQIATYNPQTGSLTYMTHVTIDGDFVLSNVEYFPKDRRVKSLCCDCSVQ